MSGMSRLVAGVLLDKIRYSKLMAGSSLLLIICCSSVYFVYDISFTGAVVILWFSIFLCCSHFTSVTVQVLITIFLITFPKIFCLGSSSLQ